VVDVRLRIFLGNSEFENILVGMFSYKGWKGENGLLTTSSGTGQKLRRALGGAEDNEGAGGSSVHEVDHPEGVLVNPFDIVENAPLVAIV
jgi:hypothetical protein